MSDNDHDEAVHMRVLADEMRLKEARAERNRSLRMSKAEGGGMAARCKLCPPKARDGRGQGNPAFSSGVRLRSADAVVAWFDAHQRTEMHEWYREHPHRVPFEHVIDERPKKKPETSVEQMLADLIKSRADV